jgi:hypothetical protein
MAGEEIQYKITPKGIIIEAHGFHDGSCKVSLEGLQKILLQNGVKSTEVDTKFAPEAYGGMNLEKSEVYARK